MARLETSLWFGSLFLRGLSCSPLPPNASSFQKAANLAHFLIIVIAFAVMFFQILIYIVQNSTDSNFITEHVSIQVAFLQLLSQMTIYRVNRRKVFRLLNSINNVVKNGSPELKRHLKRYASIGNVVYLSYTSAVLVIAIDYFLKPLFELEKELPIAAWYPFDYKQSTLLYAVVYFHQMCVLLICWLCTGIDVMFGIMVFVCCARCKVTQEILRGLNNSDNDQLQQKKRIEKSAMEFNSKIAKVVELHCEVLESVQDINDVHTYIVLVLFLTSVIIICCAGFQITNASEQHINEQFIFGGIVLAILSKFLFYFVPSDLLINEVSIGPLNIFRGHAVGMAAYHSDWESMPSRYRKCLSFIIMQSAKPLKLEGARIEPLILKNYGSFLVSTASYFTSLQAVAKMD